MSRLRSWLRRMWQPQDAAQLLRDYHEVFGGPAGQRLLQHWIDSVYATVYDGTSDRQAVLHEGRRSFVHEVLENLDRAENPEKYRVREEGE